MARTTKILSFDEARSTSRNSTSSSRRSRRATEQSSRRVSQTARRDQARTSSDMRNQTASRSESRKVAPLNLTTERIRNQQDEAAKRREEQASARRNSRKQERTKARANRMFDRQYATDSSTNEEGTPRAALYTGKMGSKQRKASRMQSTSASQVKASGSGLDIPGLFSGITVTSRSLKVATVVVCLVLTFAFLYTPAQQYYQAQREHDRLAIEYSTIEQRNDVLDVQNDALVSDAGMEDAVREKYGYVKSGEETAIVTGLSDNATDTSRDSEGIEANVLSSSVKAPEEWYTPILDALFGVS